MFSDPNSKFHKLVPMAFNNNSNNNDKKRNAFSDLGMNNENE